MKWTLADLLQNDSGNVSFDEDITIDASLFDNNSRINSVKDIHISGHGYLDEDENRFYVDLHVSGTMLVPDAITDEEIEYPFETDSDETYVFEKCDEDGVRFVTNEVIELLPAIVDDIMLEVPLQVTNASADDYPHGDGWRVITEEEYQKSQEKRIDPRLAKLKEFKVD